MGGATTAPRILIIKLWAIGDVLMATPMLAALKAQYPEAAITWLTDVANGPLLQGHPLIDEVIAVDIGDWRRLRRRGNLWGWAARTRQIRRMLKQRHFDIVIDCQAQDWWTIFFLMAPRRIGLFSGSGVDWKRRFYTDPIDHPEKPEHNTLVYLSLLRVLGCRSTDPRMEIGRFDGEEEYWGAFRAAHQLSEDRPVIILAPFTTAANRCWEPDRYARIADWLVRNGGQVILTHSPTEDPQPILEAMRARVAAATGTTLQQYAALVRRADLVISGDSSPMHLAAAVGTPYLALFGPTPAERRAPLSGQGMTLLHPLPCAPCDTSKCANPVFRQCMKLIEVAEVQRAVRTLLPSFPWIEESHEPRLPV